MQRRTGICSALLQVIEKLHGEELACKIKSEVTSDCDSDEKPRKYKRRYKRAADAQESNMTISKLIKKESQEATKCKLSNNNETEPPTIDDVYRKELKVLSTSKKYLPLLISLATNDGNEQYVCGPCSYVCYHLPSLKSHLWSHVTNSKFNYSLNIQIINAAIDYENKLNRHLLAEAKLTPLNNNNNNNNSKISNDFFNYPLDSKSVHKEQAPFVSFRCSKCSYSTIDLSILRLHKRDHYVQQTKTPINS
jgi:hypothetical protein